jgi:hypothetical protein
MTRDTYDVRLGTLGAIVCADARWCQDQYPGSQVWADELENLCSFLDSQGQFERFLPRLRYQTREHRNAALGEVRAAFVLSNAGFKITDWEPVAVPGRPGDLEIALSDSPRIFVETKAPTWQGEVFKDETRGDLEHRKDRVRRTPHFRSAAHGIATARYCSRQISQVQSSALQPLVGSLRS